MKVLALLALGGLLPVHDAPSGWAYPSECCSTRDCQHLDAGRITESGAGFTVTMDDGQFFVPHAKTRPSPDGEYHGCVNTSHLMQCFFVPPRGT